VAIARSYTLYNPAAHQVEFRTVNMVQGEDFKQIRSPLPSHPVELKPRLKLNSNNTAIAKVCTRSSKWRECSREVLLIKQIICK